MFLEGRRAAPARWIALAIATASLAMAGCGSSGDEDSTSTSTPTGTAVAETGAPSSQTDAAGQMVADFMKPPTWQSPGPEFDASAAKGKTVAIIAVTEAVPAVKQLDDEMVKALGEVGVKTTVGDGKASPTEFARLIDQAIQAKVAAIILNAVDPKAVAQPLSKAKAAGIPVITMFEADPSQPLPDGVVGRADFSYKRAGELLAAWAASDSAGKANSIAIQSSDAPSQAAMLEGFQDAYSRYCPDCKLAVKDVAVGDWQSRLAPTVRSALLADPEANYVLPMYDGMMLNIVPAVEQTGRKVKMGSLNATPEVMKFLVDDRIQMNIGESNPWLAWAAVDQALRAATGTDPVEDENVPLRVFTQENFPSEVGSEDDPATWYGDTDFKAEYRKLWGIG